MGGNDGAACPCDCPVGELRDGTIKALGTMLLAKDQKLQEANKLLERVNKLKIEHLMSAEEFELRNEIQEHLKGVDK
jgi:hypothetical protein